MVNSRDISLEEEQEEIKELQEEKNLTCFTCEQKIKENQDYFKCAFHKTIFCIKCAYGKRIEGSFRDGATGEMQYIESPKCKQEGKHIDCIWNRRTKPFETLQAELKHKGLLYQEVRK